MKFFIVCPYCTRKIEAYSRMVAETEARAHAPRCYQAALARTRKELAELAQLSLFNTEHPAREP